MIINPDFQNYIFLIFPGVEVRYPPGKTKSFFIFLLLSFFRRFRY